MNCELSVVVPIFNEENVLWNMAENLARHLDEIVGKQVWQFVLVDNGSYDQTPEIVRKVCERWPNSLSLLLDKPDYGNALREGMENAEGKWIYIINVDFWDAPFLAWSWHHRKRYDLILGSKRADPSLNKQQRYRRTLTWGLNLLLQFVFGFVGTDTHGQKFLSRVTMAPIFRQSKMRRGQFDTEFTLRAMRTGLWLAEVPVPIVEERKQRNWMIKKILQNFYDVFRLRKIMKKVPSKNTIRYHRWAREDITAELESGGKDS